MSRETIIFMALLCGLAVGMIISYLIYFPSVPDVEAEVIEDCENLSLEETTLCLRNYVSEFYNYTIRDDTKKTLEDIKINGGVVMTTQCFTNQWQRIWDLKPLK